MLREYVSANKLVLKLIKSNGTGIHFLTVFSDGSLDKRR